MISFSRPVVFVVPVYALDGAVVFGAITTGLYCDDVFGPFFLDSIVFTFGYIGYYILSLSRLRCGRARLYGSAVYYYYTIGDVYSSLGHRYYYVGVFGRGFRTWSTWKLIGSKTFKQEQQPAPRKCDFKFLFFQLCCCCSSSGFYRDERSNTSFLRDPRRRESAFSDFDDGYLLFLSPRFSSSSLSKIIAPAVRL